MIRTTQNTYHFNSPKGVTPSEHDIKYDLNVPVSDTDLGNYYRGVARLEIENKKSFDEYLDDISGHYVEGVSSWQEAHEYLVDLLQAMMVELVNMVGHDSPREYTAIINESYADGTFIDYWMDYYPEDGSVQIGLDVPREIKDNVLREEDLERMLHIKGEDLLG